MRLLLQKASDSNATVAANVIMCLGELATVGGEDVLPHVPELMEVVITRLSDSAVVKRDAALHTLGQVCSSTGYVITPLVDYPQLLPVLSRILRTETNQSVKREVIKVLGILGALDPYRRKVNQSACLPHVLVEAQPVFAFTRMTDLSLFLEQTGRGSCN